MLNYASYFGTKRPRKLVGCDFMWTKDTSSVAPELPYPASSSHNAAIRLLLRASSSYDGSAEHIFELCVADALDFLFEEFAAPMTPARYVNFEIS